MRAYLASRYSRIDELNAYRVDLVARGHHVTARWLNGEHRASENDTSMWGEFAMDDLIDIELSETLIHFAEEPREVNTRGGRFVEVGYAIGRGKRIINVGPAENVFLAHPDVECYETWAEVLEAL